MIGVRCQFVEWFRDDQYPDFLRVSLVDATGTKHDIVDKEPVLLSDDVDSSSLQPGAPVLIGAIEQSRDATTADIVLAHHVESADGRTSFTVMLDAIVDQ